MKEGAQVKGVEVRGDILIANDLGIDIQRKLVRTFPNVASGEKMRIEIQSEWVLKGLSSFVRTRRDTIATGRLPFAYCLGTISYFDQNQTRRETAFCQILTIDHLGERWESAHSPEHEYSY